MWRSQRRSVLSSEAEASRRPSEEKAMSEMPWSWPERRWSEAGEGDEREDVE